MVLRGMMIVWENEDFLTKSHDGNSRKSMMLNKKITITKIHVQPYLFLIRYVLLLKYVFL